MTFLEKKRELAQRIEATILPLIDNDYVLYGIPDYNNVGDILIWDGELELLKKTPYKCVGESTWNGYPQKKLPADVIILITGGGYFGDVWRFAWERVLAGIAPNRNNKIIILPCSVFYENEALRDKDAAYLAQFPNLTILVRDKASYDIVSKYFKNTVALVPDMAFYTSEKVIKKYAHRHPSNNVLYFKRTDKELAEVSIDVPETDYAIHDWMPMEKLTRGELIFNWLIGQSFRLKKLNLKLHQKSFYFLYRTYYRKYMIRLGLRQLSSYKKIYTTRLHGMILGTMLGREVKFIDNKNGKIRSYYDTWLLDCNNVEPLA